jgi:N-methylhydantoinase B
MLAMPGGAGYGDPADRDPALVRRDLARGYISEEVAKTVYGMSDADIASVVDAVNRGESI